MKNKDFMDFLSTKYIHRVCDTCRCKTLHIRIKDLVNDGKDNLKPRDYYECSQCNRKSRVKNNAVRTKTSQNV